MINREEKSLRHVAMVAKFLDNHKPKTSLESEFAQLQTLSIWFRREKRQLLCCVYQFQVAAVQRRERKEQNSVMHVEICCFVNKNLLLFCRSPSVAEVFGFVVIQKYHGDTWHHTSPLDFIRNNGITAVADSDLEVRGGGGWGGFKKKLPKRSISLPQPCGPRLSSKTRGAAPLLWNRRCSVSTCAPQWLVWSFFLLLCCSCVLFCYRFVWFLCGSAIMQRKVIHVNFFCYSCHICRNTVVLRTRNFATMATWHNGLPSLLPFSSINNHCWVILDTNALAAD